MIRRLDKTEWDTLALSAKRRAYLDADLTFEEIAARGRDAYGAGWRACGTPLQA